QVQRAAAEINEEFGTTDWTPLILEVKDDYARSLAACRLADVLLINPIRDGMNLVAQEGPVLSDRGCALVLSREAGAAALVGDDALLVNPFDLTQTADALHRALNMTPAERSRRSAAVAAAAADRAPARWLAEQLAALAEIWSASQSRNRTIPAGPATTRSAAAATRGASGLALAITQPAMPSARSSRTASKAARSPRSSPPYSTERAVVSRTSPLSAAPLSTPCGRSSTTSRPGSAARSSSAA